MSVLVLCALIPYRLGAQVSEVPTYIPVHYYRNNDPQSIGMGTTGSSFASGLMAGYTNPAGLSGLNNYELAFSYYPSSRFLGDMWDHYGLSLGIPLPFGFKSGLYGTYINLGKELNGSISNFQFSIARQIYLFSLGGSIRYYREKWSMDNGYMGNNDDLIINGLFIDIGMQSNLKVVDNESTGISINLGGTFCNLGPDITYKITAVDTSWQTITVKRKEPHAQVLQAGMAVKTEIFKNIDNPVKPEIIIAVENRRVINTKSFCKWNYVNSGADLKLYKSLYGRLGYSYKLSTDYDYSGWTYGIGFTTPDKLSDNFPVTLGLSYSHGISVGMINRNLISVSFTYQR